MKKQNTIKPFSRQGHFTIFDNAIIDILMPKLSGSAWKLLTVIIRKTIGWNKDSDDLSYEYLRTLAGFGSYSTVSKAIKELMDLGVIVIQKYDNMPSTYALNRDYEINLQTPKTPPTDKNATTDSVEVAATQRVAPPATDSVDNKIKIDSKQNVVSAGEKRKRKIPPQTPPRGTTTARPISSNMKKKMMTDSLFSFSQPKIDRDLSANVNAKPTDRNKQQTAGEHELGLAIRQYQEITGRPLTIRDRDNFIEMVDTYSGKDVIDAIKIAMDNNVRYPIPYAQRVLENNYTDGKIQLRSERTSSGAIRGYILIEFETVDTNKIRHVERMWLPAKTAKQVPGKILNPTEDDLKKHPKYDSTNPNWMKVSQFSQQQKAA